MRKIKIVSKKHLKSEIMLSVCLEFQLVFLRFFFRYFFGENTGLEDSGRKLKNKKNKQVRNDWNVEGEKAFEFFLYVKI